MGGKDKNSVDRLKTSMSQLLRIHRQEYSNREWPELQSKTPEMIPAQEHENMSEKGCQSMRLIGKLTIERREGFQHPFFPALPHPKTGGTPAFLGSLTYMRYNLQTKTKTKQQQQNNPKVSKEINALQLKSQVFQINCSSLWHWEALFPPPTKCFILHCPPKCEACRFSPHAFSSASGIMFVWETQSHKVKIYKQHHRRHIIFNLRRSTQFPVLLYKSLAKDY